MTTATVVGAGPNGLAAAIRLAQAGVRVTVIEAEDRAGGGARTSELTLPGLLHDDCSTAMPGATASPFFRSLNLERHGLRWLWHEATLAHPQDHGPGALMWRDLHRTAWGLGEDAAAWTRLFGPLVREHRAMIDTTFGPIVRWPRHPVALARVGLRGAPSASWIAGALRTEAARGLFAGAAAHAFGRLDTPFSAAAGIMLLATGHAEGWPIVEGGAGNLTRALVAELEGLGGRIETGRRVDQVAELDTDLTLLSVPPRTADAMLDGREPGRVKRAWARFHPGPAAFKLDLAIEGDLPWRDPSCVRAGIVHLGGSFAEIAGAEADTVRGRMPRHPFVLVAQQYLADPSRSRGGVNPIWAYAHVPHAWEGDASDAILAQIERFAPGTRERVVAMHARGPAELERHNAAYLGGDIGGGAHTMRQLVARPRLGFGAYRTGVPGVYLCGASTPPGAGVHGMGGFHAAETALSDLTR